jgi:hypothetical protein
MKLTSHAGRRSAAAAITCIALAVPTAAVASDGSAVLPVSSYGFSGVSCTAAKSCVAVGGTSQPFNAGWPLVRAWNGRKWIAEPSGRHSILLAVSCRYRGPCMAVGETNSQRVLALRWNGKKWVTERTPGTGTDGYSRLSSVTCPSAAMCMAVGTANRGNVAERWNGKGWSTLPISVPAGTILEGLDTVSCVSATNCTALGEYDDGNDVHQPQAQHWNGARWTMQLTPSAPDTSELVSVSCPAQNACVAVGNAPVDEGPPLPLAESWNGHSWAMLPAPPHPDAYALLNGVSCTSAHSCIAVGVACASSDQCFGSRNLLIALAERWNGTKWTILRTPAPSGADLESVSCTSARACTAVGHGKSGLLAERWNGTKWALQSVPG